MIAAVDQMTSGASVLPPMAMVQFSWKPAQQAYPWLRQITFTATADGMGWDLRREEYLRWAGRTGRLAIHSHLCRTACERAWIVPP